MSEDRDVAVVGMACIFPGAADLASYWRNVANGVDAISELPAGRWPGSRNLELPAGHLAHIPCRRGGFVPTPLWFDAVRHRVMPSAVDHGDPDQFIVLELMSRALADAVGFHYAWDGERREWAHVAAIFVLTPDGRVSRYLYGIDYAPRDVRLALVEASQNRIGTLADQILLFCYHYDPATGKYGMAALTSVRVAGLLTVVGLVTLVVGQLRRENSKV